MKLPFKQAATAFCFIHKRQAATRPFHVVISDSGSDEPTRDWFTDGRDAARKLKEELGLGTETANIGLDGTIDESEKKRTREFAMEDGRAAARALLEQMNADDKEEDSSDHFDLPSQKSHCMTVCMVPPPSDKDAWAQLSLARRAYKDPGFYRWPPHANLLYPFIEPSFDIDTELDQATRNEMKEEIRKQFREKMALHLAKAAEQCMPFDVTLHSFGTFGGETRGVMWADPQSSYSTTKQDNTDDTSPLIHLQNELEKQFPTCKDQKKQGSFTPHITISHYANITDALAAKEEIQASWQPLSFRVSEVYLLERKGDDGQFIIAATIPLGPESVVEMLDPPMSFPGMPSEEEDWVLEERMKMKERRRRDFKRNRRKRSD